LRSDPSCPPVSTVEVCRPTSTVDVQRSYAYFRVQQSETWENLLLLELTPEIQPQTSPYVVTWHGPNGWAIEHRRRMMTAERDWASLLQSQPREFSPCWRAWQKQRRVFPAFVCDRGLTKFHARLGHVAVLKRLTPPTRPAAKSDLSTRRALSTFQAPWSPLSRIQASTLSGSLSWLGVRHGGPADGSAFS
jgi:hypothetical protein